MFCKVINNIIIRFYFETAQITCYSFRLDRNNFFWAKWTVLQESGNQKRYHNYRVTSVTSNHILSLGEEKWCLLLCHFCPASLLDNCVIVTRKFDGRHVLFLAHFRVWATKTFKGDSRTFNGEFQPKLNTLFKCLKNIILATLQHVRYICTEFSRFVQENGTQRLGSTRGI